MRKYPTLPWRLAIASGVMACFAALAVVCRVCFNHPLDEPCALAGAFWVAVILWS
jgi:hypothetical protein